jgi:KDO2-lipid IV(A) lauroyltransferase
MHLGNFDLVGQLLAARGWALTVPVERMKPAPLFEFLRQQRASQGITIVPLEQAPRAMIRALAQGQLVGLTADRVIAGKTVTVRLFGRDAELPRGFASLVRHVEAPVVVGVGVRKSDLTFQGYLSGPIAVSRTRSAEDEVINTQRVVNVMEELIRRFPEQWMAFWPIWKPHFAEPEAATMEQQKRAAV